MATNAEPCVAAHNDEAGSATSGTTRAHGSRTAPVLVLPEPTATPPTPVAALSAEFAEQISPDVVERVVAAARHALERARMPCTAETVTRLAREQLRARAAVLAADPSQRTGELGGYRGARARTVRAALARSASD